MGIKDEFYKLIAESFTTEQITVVKEQIANIEKRTAQDQMDTVYYDACSLFYGSAKDYSNFICRLKTRPLTLNYVGTALKHKLADEECKRKFYQNCYLIVENFYNHHRKAFEKIKDAEPFMHAITNAVVPDLLEWENVGELILQTEDRITLENIYEKVQKGNVISKINFGVDVSKYSTKHFILHSEIYNKLFLSDFRTYVSHHLLKPLDTKSELAKLKSIQKDIAKRIAIRIAMVFVKFDVLQAATKTNKYILRTPDGHHVELTNKIMKLIFDLMQLLGKVYGKNKDGMLGLFKLRKDRNNNYATNELSTKDEQIGKIKKLLEVGKKKMTGIFTYNQICTLPEACLYM